MGLSSFINLRTHDGLVIDFWKVGKHEHVTFAEQIGRSNLLPGLWMDNLDNIAVNNYNNHY